MSPPRCAAPGCDNPVFRVPGARGRPPIYCSDACRPHPGGRRVRLTVELEQQEADGERSGADWTVRLRRGSRVVVVGSGLGRLTAAALADQLRRLLEPAPQRRRTDRDDMRDTLDAHEGARMV